MANIGSSDLDVSGLSLGANVFGWTASEADSFAVLDAYLAAGGNFIDTADLYAGTESEAIIGRWLAARGTRDQVVLATKVGMLEGSTGAAPANVRRALEGSLERLQTDHVDLYYIHRDDPTVPLPDALAGLDALVREGKVRYVGASNFSAERLSEALAVADRENLARFVALQPHYNLVERAEYEGALAQVVGREGLSCVPFFALAKGFLTGKYRTGGPEVDSPRAGSASAYLDARGERVLEALDEVAGAHDVSVAAVSLAWLHAQPTVVAPIASARSVEQLEGLLPMLTLELTAAELDQLSDAAGVAVAR